MNRIAECCCGQLLIEVTGEPEIHGICHCNNCKKRTGSAFGISSYFNNDQVLFKSGETNCYSLHNSEQNHDQQRYFCKTCGTTLFWSVSTSPQLTGVAGGCFVKTSLGEPQYSASHTNICLWLSLPEGMDKNS
jgi:hypothetical protein